MVAATVVVMAAAVLTFAVVSPDSPPTPTASWLTGTTSGGFIGPTSFGTWPVGHADCFSFAHGLVCVTPTRLTTQTVTPYPGAKGGQGYVAFGNGPAIRSRFLVTNSSDRPFTIDARAQNTTLGYQVDGGTSVSVSPVASPTTGCGSVGPGVVTIAARTSSTICFDYAMRDVPAHLYGPAVWTHLTFAGIAQWASGRFVVPYGPNPSGQPLVYAMNQPPDGLAGGAVTDDAAMSALNTSPANGPGGAPVTATLTDLSGGDLGYTADYVGTTIGRRAHACEAATELGPCYFLTPRPSHGPLLMRLAFTNALSFPWTIRLRHVYADVQERCTASGCQTVRLMPAYPASVNGVRCAGSSVASLGAARGGVAATTTVCMVFPTTRGAIIYRLSYDLQGTFPRSLAARAGYHPNFMDGASSFHYFGYTPPGPF